MPKVTAEWNFELNCLDIITNIDGVVTHHHLYGDEWPQLQQDINLAIIDFWTASKQGF